MRNDIVETIINQHTRELLREIERELQSRNPILARATRDLRLDFDQAIEELKMTTTG
jgi:hypothetical protein